MKYRVRIHRVLTSQALALALFALAPPAAQAVVSQWSEAGSQNWSAATWTAGMPGAAGDTANLTANYTDGRTLTVNTTPRTVGNLNIGDSTSPFFPVTLAASGGATLTFNNSGSGATLGQSSTSNTDTISAPVILADNLTVNNSSSLFITGAISGTGQNLTKATGTGLLGLLGANTYTGTTTISAGTITLGRAENAGVSGPLGNPATPAESIVFGGGTLQYSSLNNYDYSSRFSTAAGQAYSVDTADQNITWATALGGAGSSLSKVGSGTLTLTTANSYTGGTTVHAGTLLLNSPAVNTFTGGITLNGGTLLADFANVGSTPDLINSSNTLALGGGTMTVKCKGAGYSAAQTLGDVTVNARGGRIAGDVNGGTSTTITLGSLTTTAAGGSLLLGTAGADTTGLTITTVSAADATGIYGGRTIWFNGTASTGYDWATTLSGSSPYLLSGLGSGGYTALPTASGSSAVNYNMAAATSLGGSFSVNTLKLEAPSGDLAIGANTLTISGGGLLMTGTTPRSITGTAGATRLNGSASGDLVIHQYNSGGLTIGAVIGDNGSATALTKAGSGKLTLTGVNTYSGVSYINGGTVNLGVAETAGTSGPLGKSVASNPGSIVLGGGTLQCSAANAVDYSGRFSTAPNQQYNIDTNNQNVTWATALTSPGGSLTKSGSGTLTLSVNNTYTGGTTISGGTVAFTTSPAVQQNNCLGWPGNVTVNAGGTLTVQRNVLRGTLTLNGGTFFNSNGFGSTWAGPVILAATSTINFTNASTISGVVSGSGGLTKIGGGPLNLNAACTYSGNTTISGGSITLGANASINSTPLISIAAGATFDVSAKASPYTWSTSTTLSSGGTTTAANLKGPSGGTVDLGSQPIVLTYTGLNPALTLSQGTLTLNANPFTVNTASPLAPGTYNIVTQTTGTITGAGTYPGVTGTAIGSGRVGTISVSGANVVLTISQPTLTVSAFPGTQTAGAAGSVTVTALDGSGNPATAYIGTVHFTSSDGAAVLPADYTFVPADNGTKTFSVTLKTVGTQSITGTDTATGAITGTQSGIAVTPAAASALTVSGFPSPKAAGAADSVTVTAKDAYGNTATGYTGTVHFTSTDGAAAMPPNYTFTGGDNGVHTFTNGVTLNTVGGPWSITATDTVTGSITGTQSGISVLPGTTATTLVVSGFPGSPTAGVADSVTVTAKNGSGNTVTGYTGTIHFTSSDGAATLPGNYTFVPGDSGSHTFSGGVTLYAAGMQSITATDTGTAIHGTQAGITVYPAAAATLTVSGFPSPQFVGTAGSVTVTALDAYGNTATGYSGTIQFGSSDGLAVLPPNYTFTGAGGDNGVHAFSGGVTFTTAGTQDITATDTVTGTITGIQSGITVNLIPSVFTWASGAGFWDSASNWTNDAGIVAVPDNAGKTNYTLNFNVAGTYTATHNLGNGFLLNRLNFGGSSVTLAGFNLALVSNDLDLPQINQSTGVGATVGNNIALDANTTVGVTGSGDLTLNGLISGPGSLTKTGGGTLTMGTASNTYEGETLISGGTFTSILAGRAGFGTGAVTLESGASIVFNGPNPNVTNTGTFNGGTISANNGFGATWGGPVTLNATPTINAVYNMNFNGIVSGAGGLNKSGGSTLTLTRHNTYTGDTTVNSGSLILTSTGGLTFAITDASSNKVTGAGAASLDGKFMIDTSLVTVATGTWTLVDTTTKSFTAGFSVDGFADPELNNTWTKLDDLDPAKTWTFDEGTGVLTLAATPIGTAYDTWATTDSGLSGADALAGADPDQDGLVNALEFVLGGQPNPARAESNSAGLLPTVSTNLAGDLVFTFERADLSVGTATVTFQWSSDLGFPPVNDVEVPAAGTTTTNDVEVAITDGSPKDTVVITVPAAKAAGGTLFGRLEVLLP